MSILPCRCSMTCDVVAQLLREGCDSYVIFVFKYCVAAAAVVDDEKEEDDNMLVEVLEMGELVVEGVGVV